VGTEELQCGVCGASDYYERRDVGYDFSVEPAKMNHEFLIRCRHCGFFVRARQYWRDTDDKGWAEAARLFTEKRRHKARTEATMNTTDEIRTLLNKMNAARDEAREADDRHGWAVWELTKALAEVLHMDPHHLEGVSGGWNCLESPIGCCLYNDAEDPAHDDCLFCHEPEERK